jgi:hypothetical protein
MKAPRPPPNPDTTSAEDLIGYFIREQGMSLEDARQAAASAISASGDYQAQLDSNISAAKATMGAVARAEPPQENDRKVATGETWGALFHLRGDPEGH